MLYGIIRKNADERSVIMLKKFVYGQPIPTDAVIEDIPLSQEDNLIKDILYIIT